MFSPAQERNGSMTNGRRNISAEEIPKEILELIQN